MDLVTNFTVEDTFLIPGRGLIVTGELENVNHRFRAGTSVKIIRPDGTEIFSVIRGIDISCGASVNQKKIGALLEETITKSDVPHGSKITITEYNGRSEN
jgi:hypothetical protein